MYLQGSKFSIPPEIFSHVFSFVLVAAILFFAPQRTVAQAKLEVVGGMKYDVGILPEDTLYTRSLTLKNIGRDTLSIESVRTSCGCTVAKTDTNGIAPGDSTLLRVSFNTKNFDGPVKKDVYFETNDTSMAKVDIVINAVIKAFVEMRPHFVNFHDVKLGIEVSRNDTLINNTENPITIDSVLSHDTQISANIQNKVIMPHSYSILETRVKSVKIGNIIGQIDLKTNSRIKPLLQLTYIAYAKQ